MYIDSRENRLLLKNGISVTPDFDLAIQIFNGEELKGKVLRSSAAETYELFYKEQISTDAEDTDPEPVPHTHTDEDVDEILRRIESSPRFKGSDTEIDRVEKELDFFVRTDNIVFLKKLVDLIDRFKREGVVWGVGRGSSCSSYVLFLLEVNDIDPIRYSIPFSELSKEQEI